MKLNLSFFYASFCFLFIINFSSCKTDTPDVPDVDSTVLCATDSLLFTCDKDASLIIINETADWTVTSDASWLSSTAITGKGKTGILIGATKNDGFQRTAFLTLKSGKKEQKIKVRQSGASVVELTVINVKFRLVKVTSGSYVMGETTNNSPAHTVKLSDYYICESEVTNGLWKAVMGALPYDTLTGYTGSNQHTQLDLPVTAVTWNDITAKFFPALKTKSGIEFRLPTEAEWEFAAMGGNASKAYTFSGSNVLDEVGWDSQFSGATKHDVMQKAANELNLYDMSGNASEWCSDWHETYYTAYDVLTNPKGPVTGVYKIIRGGNYLSEAGILGYNECKVKQRRYAKPSGYQGSWGDTGNPTEPQIFTCNAVGFRFVVTIQN